MKVSLLSILLPLLIWTATAIAQPRSDRSRIPLRGNDDFDSVLLQPKIVGGTPASPGSYPWQVSLQRSDFVDPLRAHYCGASVYNARWLVTAAHCVARLQPSDIEVIAGTQTLSAAMPRVPVKRMIVNKQYVAATHDYDIALILLARPLTLGAAVQSIAPLAAAEETIRIVEATPLYVAGWGAMSEGGSQVRTLRTVKVPSVPTSECRNPFSYGDRVTDRMLCAGDAQGLQDSCQGDSGGPLTTGSGGPNARLVGIVSWGDGCGKPGKPGVYARIPVLNDWIERCVAAPDTCQ